MGSFAVTMTESEEVDKYTIDTWGKSKVVEDVFYDVPALGLSGCHLKGTIEFQAQGLEEEGEGEEEATQFLVEPTTLLGSGAGCPTDAVESGFSSIETADKTPLKLDAVKTP